MLWILVFLNSPSAHLRCDTVFLYTYSYPLYNVHTHSSLRMWASVYAWCIWCHSLICCALFILMPAAISEISAIWGGFLEFDHFCFTKKNIISWVIRCMAHHTTGCLVINENSKWTTISINEWAFIPIHIHIETRIQLSTYPPTHPPIQLNKSKTICNINSVLRVIYHTTWIYILNASVACECEQKLFKALHVFSIYSVI